MPELSKIVAPVFIQCHSNDLGIYQKNFVQLHMPLLVVNIVFHFKLQNLGWVLWRNIREESFSQIVYCYCISVRTIHPQLLSTTTLKLILHNFGNSLLEKELNRIFSKVALLLSSSFFQKQGPQK